MDNVTKQLPKSVDTGTTRCPSGGPQKRGIGRWSSSPGHCLFHWEQPFLQTASCEGRIWLWLWRHYFSFLFLFFYQNFYDSSYRYDLQMGILYVVPVFIPKSYFSVASQKRCSASPPFSIEIPIVFSKLVEYMDKWIHNQIFSMTRMKCIGVTLPTILFKPESIIKLKTSISRSPSATDFSFLTSCIASFLKTRLYFESIPGLKAWFINLLDVFQCSSIGKRISFLRSTQYRIMYNHVSKNTDT